MAIDPRPTSDYVDRAEARRDAVALLLVVVGVIGLLVCAYKADRLLFWTACSTLTTAAGVVVGIRRRT